MRKGIAFPPDSLYLVGWYPCVCGNGSTVSRNNGKKTFAASSQFGLYNSEVPDAAATGSISLDHERSFNCRIPSIDTYETQLVPGGGDGCFNVSMTTSAVVVTVSIQTVGKPSLV